jgi:Protein of unknown function (DUF1501)
MPMPLDSLPRSERLVRRDALRIGCLTALGLTMGSWSRLRAGAPSTRAGGARACILLWLDGGPSHLETFDPKPEAPAEVRGPFGTIATAVAGVRLGECFPGLARRLDRMALVRSVTSPLGEHNLGSQYMLTGYAPTPALAYPSLGAVVAHLRGGRGSLPPYVAVPQAGPSEGPGYLPPTAAPFGVGGDPAKADFRVRDLDPYPGLDGLRLERRRTFLQTLEGFRRGAEEGAAALAPDDPEFEQAYRLASSSRPACWPAG